MAELKQSPSLTRWALNDGWHLESNTAGCHPPHFTDKRSHKQEIPFSTEKWRGRAAGAQAAPPKERGDAVPRRPSCRGARPRCPQLPPKPFHCFESLRQGLVCTGCYSGTATAFKFTPYLIPG